MKTTSILEFARPSAEMGQKMTNGWPLFHFGLYVLCSGKNRLFGDKNLANGLIMANGY